MLPDKIDMQILKILNQNGRTKFTTIAKTINRTEGTVRNRIRRLKENGVIQGFRVITDPENLGYKNQAIIKFDMEPSYEAYAQMDQLPFICERKGVKLMSLYRSNGESSFILELLGENKQDLDCFISDLGKLLGIFNIEVLMKEERIYHNLS